MPGEEWTTDEQKVHRYLGRADEFPHRTEGESVLLEHVPRDARRILDLGTGDGRLLALLRVDRHEMHGVGLDFSELMLGAARKRFTDEERIELVEHDLTEPLPAAGEQRGAAGCNRSQSAGGRACPAPTTGPDLDRLIAEGRVSRPMRSGLPEPLELAGDPRALSRALDAIRGDR